MKIADEITLRLDPRYFDYKFLSLNILLFENVLLGTDRYGKVAGLRPFTAKNRWTINQLGKKRGGQFGKELDPGPAADAKYNTVLSFVQSEPF